MARTGKQRNLPASLGWATLSLALAYGIFARLYNLGLWELTIDEYYIVMSVQSILDNGVPSFGCGGYYERGLLQQYLTAPLLAYCDNSAFAARLLPALANILAFPLLFKLSEKVSGSRLTAGIVTALFALSLWEIEFARFARMYSFFQLVFILQLYWLVEIVIEDRIDRYKYLLATTALGIFVYQGVIFSLAICLLPIVLCTKQLKPTHYIGLAATALLIAIRTKIKFRNLHAEPRYPIDYIPPEGRGGLPVYPLELMHGELGGFWLLLFGFTAASILWIMLRSAYMQRYTIWQLAVLVCLFSCALLHQFAIALVVAAAALSFGLCGNRATHFVKISVILVFPLVAFWLLFGSLHAEHGIGGTTTLLLRYPSIIWYVLGPFFQAIPRESLLLFPVLLVGGIYVLRDVWRNGKISAPSLLLGVSILLILAQSALVTPEKSTRYTFFLYPALLLLFCHFCIQLPKLGKFKSALQTSLSLVLLGLFVLASENYYLPHLSAVSSAEYNFRMPYQRHLQFHFYQRYSFVDTANYVNDNLEADDQVILTTPGIDYYLDQLDFTFRDISSQRFRETSACSGDRYIWNDSPLIYTEQDLLAQIRRGKNATWIITGENGKGWSPEDQMVSSHFKQYRVFTGRDDQVRVYRVPPN